MQVTMTFADIMTLLGSMIILAMVPSVSVLTVSARAASAGFVHGAFTTFGIVLGDIIYILIAIFGLTILTKAMGAAAFLIKYAAGGFLVWQGIRLWMAAERPAAGQEGAVSPSLLSSFMTGLLITLADQKVVVFYLGFLPAFIDLAAISYADAAIIMATSATAVGFVKLSYAFFAERAGVMMFGASRIFNRAAGGVMVGVGVYLFATVL